ncbi:MAG: RNA-binding protein [Acidobacteriota bacterium]
MAKKLYVGNLPFSVTEDQLRALFEPLGEVVSAKVISDKFTNQSKGFGFVEMANDPEAQEAISRLNETNLGARKIVVNEARPMERRDGPGAARDSGHRDGGHRDRGPR